MALGSGEGESSCLSHEDLHVGVGLVGLLFEGVGVVLVGVGADHVLGDEVGQQGAGESLYVEAELDGVLEFRPSFRAAVWSAFVGVSQVDETAARSFGRCVLHDVDRVTEVDNAPELPLWGGVI